MRAVAGTRKRFDHPAYRDGWAIATLWAAEGPLVRLLGDASRSRPEAEHIRQAFREVHAAIDILNERAGRRRDV